jgi:hypothetical protein
VANVDITLARFDRLDRTVTGFIVQPVLTLEDVADSPLLLADLANVRVPGQFKPLRITGEIGSPQLDLALALIAVQTYDPPPRARQPQELANIDTGNG